jgi:[acyl-carrier-protein] S-malonyltransferase
MIAFLFGGQGSELPRIGADLAERSARLRELIDAGSRAAGEDLPRLLRQGSPRLYRTEVLQPAMVAVGLAVAARLEAVGIKAGFTAGHSLGELAAWAACGSIAPEEAIAAAGVRGRLMARLAGERPGGMLALECDDDRLREAMACGRERGELALAAHNGPRTWTLSGEQAAIGAVAARFPAKTVPVQGPWHSGAMSPGVEELGKALRAIPRRPAGARFLSNRTGAIVEDESTIPELIAGQLDHPVLWMRTLEALREAGVRRFVAIGAGKFLRSLAGHTLGRDFPIHTTETIGELERAVEELGA